MSLNPSKGNMYDFVTHTWNTVKGACPHGCYYCYMKRFGEQKPVHFDEKELKTDLGAGNFIFVGSSCDMFADDIDSGWIFKTTGHCNNHPLNQYLFQSKNTYGFYKHLGYFPRNSVLCTTIETNRFYDQIMRRSPMPEQRAFYMGEHLCNFRRFVTIEPIMDFDLSPLVDLVRRCEPEQVNIGADSGGHHLPEPSAAKVLALIDELGKFTTIARKTNLARLLK